MCDPVVGTTGCNSRRPSSFTGRAEHQSIKYLENVNYLRRFNERESARPGNKAYVGRRDEHVSRKSVNLPKIVNHL